MVFLGIVSSAGYISTDVWKLMPMKLGPHVLPSDVDPGRLASERAKYCCYTT